MPDDLGLRGSTAPPAASGPRTILSAVAVALLAAGCSAPFSLPSGDELIPLRPAGGSTAGQASSGTRAAGVPRWPLAALGPDRSDSAIIRTSAEGPAEPDQLAANVSAEAIPGYEDAVAYGDLPASGEMAATGDVAAQADAFAGEIAADLATEGLVSLTLDEALDYAQSHHPLLMARVHEVSAAKGALAGAGLLPNPELTMDTDVPVNEGRGADFQMRVMFTLPTAGKRRLREAVAAAGVARARWALKSETERVLLDATDVGMEVLYLQELALLQSELSELAARRAEIERSRFEARTATFADAMEAEMDASRLALEHKTTLAQLRAARWSLGQAIGLGPPQPVHLVGGLPFQPFLAVPLEQVLAGARASRPELAEAGAALSESSRELALAQAEAKPDIRLGPRYEDRLGDGNDSMGARLDFDLPLFDRNQGAIGESAGLARAAGAMVEAAELNTLGDVARAYVRLVSLQSWLNHYQAQVMPIVERTQATLAEEEARRALPADQASDMLRAVIRLRLDQLQLRYEYNQLRRRLKIFLGQDVDELALPAGAILEQPADELLLPAGPSGSGADASIPSVRPDASAPGTESDAAGPGLPGLPGIPGLIPPEGGDAFGLPLNERASPPDGGAMPEVMPLPGLREPAAGPFEVEEPSERPFELRDSTDAPEGVIEPPAIPGNPSD